MKRNTTIRDTVGFDDILLVPAETQVKPDDVQTKTRLTKTIELGIPVISGGHADVTDSAMAIALAQAGGLGIIHGNMPLGKQVEEVRRVKRAQGNIVQNPITISPDSSVAEAFDLMSTYKISGLPVIDNASQKVAGIITSRDIRFYEDYAKPVSELMTAKVITAKAGISRDDTKKILHQNRIEKLVLVDDAGKCVGLITVKDIDKLEKFTFAARDGKGGLLAAASVSSGKEAVDRASAMADAGLDVVFIDVAHGHSKEVVSTVSRLRQQRSTEIQIVAGNVATAAGARSLIDAGADAIKVGIGGTACATSRKFAGVGMPQLSALLEIAEECGMQNIPVILDGGVCCPANYAKAIAAGANAVVFTEMFRHTDEAPAGTAAKAPAFDPLKLADDYVLPQRRGSAVQIAQDLLAGLRTAMAYTGSKDIRALQENSTFVRVK